MYVIYVCICTHTHLEKMVIITLIFLLIPTLSSVSWSAITHMLDKLKFPHGLQRLWYFLKNTSILLSCYAFMFTDTLFGNFLPLVIFW